MMQGSGTGGKYIKFKDPVVEQICVSKWSSDGIGLTPEDAAKVTDIGTTFKGNTEITSFDELEYFGVTDIFGDSSNAINGAFYNCTSLKSVKVSPNLTRFGYSCFNGCTSLYNINIPTSCQYIERYSFKNVPAHIDVDVPNIIRIGNGAFYESGIVSLKAPTLDTINDKVCNHCIYLTQLDLQNVSQIKGGAFHSANLEDVELYLPKLTLWSYGLFTNTNIKKIIDLGSIVDFDSDVSTGNAMFANCKKLEYANLPSTLKVINNNVFNGCESLEVVKLNSTTPPTLGTGVFTGTPSTMKIYVPNESVEAYKTAPNWSAFANQIKPISEYVEPNE